MLVSVHDSVFCLFNQNGTMRSKDVAKEQNNNESHEHTKDEKDGREKGPAVNKMSTEFSIDSKRRCCRLHSAIRWSNEIMHSEFAHIETSMFMGWIGRSCDTCFLINYNHVGFFSGLILLLSCLWSFARSVSIESPTVFVLKCIKFVIYFR